MPDLPLDEPVDEDDEGNDDGPRVWIIEERPALREGKVFVDYDERATIAENLEAAYVALDHAFRGIWIPKALEWGQVREYWNDGDIDELEALTLDAGAAVERAWRALSAVVEAHTAQVEAELDTDEDDT
ncbi:MAG: hypothetical protein M3011_05625 [Actinomycetota bacterium]|nr:hypothetical protein [Actinomycetota bacterium]